MRWHHVGFALVAMALLTGAVSGAQVIETSGDMVWKGKAPSDLTRHTVESDMEQMLFVERENVILEEDLEAADDQTIPAGTEVTSFLVHADPVGSPDWPGVWYSGSATFSGEILGVFSWVNHLEATDPILGLPDTEYDSNRWLNTDFGDQVEINGNKISVELSNRTLGALDEVRLVVEADPADSAPVTTPSPSTLAVAAPLAAGLILRRPYRRRQRR